MQLTPHFSLEELTASETAVRYGIDNTPPLEIIANLKLLAEALEKVRATLGHPIHINSGYRSSVLNIAVHGSRNSAHTRGLAADIICPAFGTPLEVCRAIAASNACDYDQLIHEGAWCHYAIREPGSPERHELLTAHFGPEGTTYSEGLVTA